MNCDYMVIGAGVSGMASALILARQGFRVLLVERAPQPAPLLRGFKRQGLQFDSGFHYAGGLGKGQVLSAYLEHLGVAEHLELEPHSVCDTLRLTNGNGDLQLPYGYETLEAELCSRFPDEYEGIRRYLQGVRSIFESTPFLNLEAEAEPEFTSLHGSSLQSVLDSWIRDKALRHALALHHFFYGVTPKDVTFQDHARFVGSYYASTRFIKGGGHALARAFEAALYKAGVMLSCGRGVQHVRCSASGALTGVQLEDGEELCCKKGIIATVHPRLLTQIAPEMAFRPSYSANLQNLKETPSAFMLFGACSSLPLLRKGAMHVAPKTGASLEDLPHQSLEQRQMFLAQALDGEGNGEQPLGVICPARHQEMDRHATASWKERGPDYAQHKQELAERLEANLLRHCPELRGNWRMLDAATPLTFRRYANTPTGSLYGVQHALDARCPLPQTRLPGFYVAGQAVAGPGVLGATVSAYVACSRILGLERLLREVRQCL